MFNFEQRKASDEEQEQLKLFMDKIREERSKAVFNKAEYIDVLGTESLMVHLEDTYLLDSTRWN
jgi:hypothetical protein|tara:strand:+ start:2717 stop:2908 length:192 start_codon:yes stop_codon:yes gene_type:complete